MTAPTFRHRLEYGLVLGLRALVRVLPSGLADALGTAIGLTAYALISSRRRVAAVQLQAAFPTRSARECRALARATFAYFGRLLVAVLKFSTLTREQMRARIECEGAEHLRLAHAAGKGVLISTGHFGNWEINGVAQPLVPLPLLSVLARPLDNPYLQDFVERFRSTTGNRVIYRQGAVRRTLRALHANEVIAILIDQHILGTDAVQVTFFNRPVATTSAVATLALRTGAPIVPAVCLPLKGGRFKLIYEPPIELPAAGSVDPVRELTQRCTDVLEMYVRRYPQYWLWMHRRWRDLHGEPQAAQDPLPISSAEDESRGASD